MIKVIRKLFLLTFWIDALIILKPFHHLTISQSNHYTHVRIPTITTQSYIIDQCWAALPVAITKTMLTAVTHINTYTHTDTHRHITCRSLVTYYVRLTEYSLEMTFSIFSFSKAKALIFFSSSGEESDRLGLATSN